MCWLLLGVDDVVVRWWRDERVMDRGYCSPRFRGEDRQRASRVARSRRWSYRRGLVADAAYVLRRACADTRCGAVRGSTRRNACLLNNSIEQAVIKFGAEFFEGPLVAPSGA
jgi:hypothetical protein